MTKLRIKEAAVRLFFEKGYGSCSMRDLASAVGVEAASIYNHYPSKEDILATICLELMENQLKGLHNIIHLRRTTVAQLEQFISYYLKFQIDNWLAFQVTHTENKHLESKHEATFKKLRKSFENQVLELINRGIQEEKFYSLDSEIVLNTLLSALRWRQNSPKKLEKLYQNKLNEMYQVILKGIVKK
ncbi:MAG: TetR/AcrR family transcriptional regulator [Saprospiraceae bacterium]|nr:TetR/AcrR family transcriptional regulator [Saprospiraceae bacterium]MBK9222551.1 TetR/AcrR family transcriptional regulator [Saprospiraceae bacterium]MBK9727386.1 TetR/AcrR family transcriptional regulator [Saprospiraceae bacterium]